MVYMVDIVDIVDTVDTLYHPPHCAVFPLSGWAGAGQGGVAQLAPHMPVTARRGSLQLWQFLIAMLEVSRHSALVVMMVVLQDPANCGAITWTGRGMEFKLIEPEEVGAGVEEEVLYESLSLDDSCSC